MRIEQLVMGPFIEEKIETKHGVTPEEVEEICLYNEPTHLLRRTRDDLYALFGRTFAGRYLLVILAPRGARTYQVVTARDQTRQERRAYHEQKG